ncbi:hypothetical protein HDG35_006986 [Paraburkholderia sp. JPY681]|nr:hypothetical protein [Paraburkholderia atlantica]
MKNTAQITTLFALGNLWMARKALCERLKRSQIQFANLGKQWSSRFNGQTTNLPADSHG